MKVVLAIVSVLAACMTVCNGQTCQSLNPFVLHFGVCLNLDEIEHGATAEMFEDIRESGVTISDIAVEDLELATRGCRGARATGGNLQLTLPVENFVLTGRISRKRLFRTRRGTFRATATDSTVTCTIRTESCVRTAATTCTVNFGRYNVDFTGRLLGIIAKRRIADGIKARLPREITQLVIKALDELLEELARRSG